MMCVGMVPVIACNALLEDYSEPSASSTSGGAGGATSTTTVGGAGGTHTGSGAGGTSGTGGTSSGTGGSPDPCGNGTLDSGEECDLGGSSAPWCVSCLVTCPDVSNAAVRVGAPNEPHCYVGVPGGSKSDASNDCTSLGADWYLFEFNDMSEHDWLHANRSAVGISSSKYFWQQDRSE